MKADARAPATTSPKIASGILNAARYASRSGVSPKCAPMTDSLSQPSTRLATRVTIMIAEARAIDIGNPQILRHQVSFARNAGKETQALGAEAHPPDPAAHLDADDRPLRGAYRRARGPRSHQQRGRGGLRDDLGRGKCARQSREARFCPQEQRAPAPEQNREGRDEGEEEDLSALRGQPLSSRSISSRCSFRWMPRDRLNGGAPVARIFASISSSSALTLPSASSASRSESCAASRGRSARQSSFADSFTASVFSGSYAEGRMPVAHLSSQ